MSASETVKINSLGFIVVLASFWALLPIMTSLSTIVTCTLHSFELVMLAMSKLCEVWALVTTLWLVHVLLVFLRIFLYEEVGSALSSFLFL